MAARRSLLCPGQFQQMHSSPCKASSIATLRARYVATRPPLCSCRAGHAMLLPSGSPEPELVAETPGSGASGDTTAACAALPTAPSHAPASDCGDRISGCTPGNSGTTHLESQHEGFKTHVHSFQLPLMLCTVTRQLLHDTLLQRQDTTENDHHLIGADVHGFSTGESMGQIQIGK